MQLMGTFKYIILWLASIWKAAHSLFYLKWTIRNFTDNATECHHCLTGKTAIVTGGNSGIGYATSVLLASRGCRVIIACRRDATQQKEAIMKLTGNNQITTKRLDLSRLESVRQFAQDIAKTEEKIDILVNNAGIGATSQRVTEDGLNTMMQVNYFGHILLTYLLVDKLKVSSSPRVIFLSSLMANVHDLTVDNLNETNFKMDATKTASHYSNAKLCSILAAQEMSKEFQNYGIIVNSADPGIVKTSIFDSSYSVDLENHWSTKIVLECLLLLFKTDAYFSAKTILHLAASKDLEAGSHYFRCRVFETPSILKDRRFCSEIWQKTKQLLLIDS
ncbi:retinol dehydrogenase 13-like [Coccinella septempunctata]|uniref:retinol dehydrogenase 13-like n=1 Tax=Coccinella septempunctata TaxID=41139 RepID=UPI001D091BFA|nr:retinol dehydrogenase 13-like [Coccinella septempunctata]